MYCIPLLSRISRNFSIEFVQIFYHRRIEDSSCIAFSTILDLIKFVILKISSRDIGNFQERKYFSYPGLL